MEFATKSAIGICKEQNFQEKEFARNGISKERGNGIRKEWTL